jgi:hypothetical protein
MDGAFIQVVKKIEEHKIKCRGKWNDKNKLFLMNEELIVNNAVNWDYVFNYNIGSLLDIPLIKNEESRKRLASFIDICLSDEAPMSQGYYFNDDVSLLQFMRGVVKRYYGKDFYRYFDTWDSMDSEKIVDQRIGNKETFFEHKLFFIVNSYNRNCENKRHRALYDIVNTIMADRNSLCKRTFLLSLTHDVGPDKGKEHGFSIPMFPIKERIHKVLEAKANGKNPW